MNDQTLRTLVSHLESYGCRSLPVQTDIGGIPFQFSGILVGPPNTLDLVIIERVAPEGQQRLFQQVQAVALALDTVQSRRSLTLVLFGAHLEPEVETGLARLARVLYFHESKEYGLRDFEVREALSIMRPVEAPTTVSAVKSDPVQRVWEALNTQQQMDLAAGGLFKASVFGSEAVTNAFTDWVRSALASESSLS